MKKAAKLKCSAPYFLLLILISPAFSSAGTSSGKSHDLSRYRLRTFTEEREPIEINLDYSSYASLDLLVADIVKRDFFKDLECDGDNVAEYFDVDVEGKRYLLLLFDLALVGYGTHQIIQGDDPAQKTGGAFYIGMAVVGGDFFPTLLDVTGIKDKKVTLTVKRKNLKNKTLGTLKIKYLPRKETAELAGFFNEEAERQRVLALGSHKFKNFCRSFFMEFYREVAADQSRRKNLICIDGDTALSITGFLGDSSKYLHAYDFTLNDTLEDLNSLYVPDSDIFNCVTCSLLENDGTRKFSNSLCLLYPQSLIDIETFYNFVSIEEKPVNTLNKEQIFAKVLDKEKLYRQTFGELNIYDISDLQKSSACLPGQEPTF